MGTLELILVGIFMAFLTDSKYVFVSLLANWCLILIVLKIINIL